MSGGVAGCPRHPRCETLHSGLGGGTVKRAPRLGIAWETGRIVTAQPFFTPYASIVFVIALVGVVTTAMMLLAHLVKPAKKGAVKDSTYESGMPPIGDARGRFNVRFYIVAMRFLLFDVEVVFLWPWVPVFHKAATQGEAVTSAVGPSAGAGFLLAAMAVFAGFLVVGFAYEWRRGMFQWD